MAIYALSMRMLTSLLEDEIIPPLPRQNNKENIVNDFVGWDQYYNYLILKISGYYDYIIYYHIIMSQETGVQSQVKSYERLRNGT